MMIENYDLFVTFVISLLVSILIVLIRPFFHGSFLIIERVSEQNTTFNYYIMNVEPVKTKNVRIQIITDTKYIDRETLTKTPILHKINIFPQEINYRYYRGTSLNNATEANPVYVGIQVIYKSRFLYRVSGYLYSVTPHIFRINDNDGKWIHEIYPNGKKEKFVLGIMENKKRLVIFSSLLGLEFINGFLFFTPWGLSTIVGL